MVRGFRGCVDAGDGVSCQPSEWRRVACAGHSRFWSSGLHGQGVDRLIEAAFKAYEVWNRRVSTARLNRWLDGVLTHHPPPAVSGRRIRLRYMTQPKTRPPHFIVFCSRPENLPESYTRYLINGLRERFDMPGTPIRLSYRKGDNPYHNKD